ATDDVMLSSSPLPMPNFSMTQEPTCDGLKIKFNNLTANGSNYYWDFGDGTTSSNPSPTHLFDYNTLPNIKLVVVNGDCRDSIMVTDTIGEWHTYQNFTIPSVFTPNGDGINDYFEIQTDGDLTRCTFMKMIMNRWGVVIYQPDYGRLSWDGTTVAGVPVPSGTYFYLVQIKDKEYSGYVQLIRDEK
ncbi:MAG: gliding motility-associated C-terminal domain-containing protein, partial [Phaeodactylibacter sp.]|nr:gliding motility-associated C-terminal domain-containing protein [Phaeodactylibacter sp.]